MLRALNRLVLVPDLLSTCLVQLLTVAHLVSRNSKAAEMYPVLRHWSSQHILACKQQHTILRKTNPNFTNLRNAFYDSNFRLLV